MASFGYQQWILPGCRLTCFMDEGEGSKRENLTVESFTRSFSRFIPCAKLDRCDVEA